jgi:hypothetical protein
MPALLSKLTKSFNTLKDPEYLLRPVVVELVPMMTERIHQQGQDAKGEQIGTYSESYMKRRTGRYSNSAVKTRGVEKGKTKNAGVFTRGKNAGQPRPRYNRSNDTKVVVSLTRQLENDWSVIATASGYGIGFLNSHNSDKAGWVEETYNKKIFALTDKEKEFAKTRLTELIQGALNS